VDPGLLGRPVQLAYGVRDVVRAAETFTGQTGAGPFFVSAHIPLASARVFGKTADFDHSSAYGQWGDVMVELVEEHTPPIVEPGSGIHHIAFFVADTVEVCKRPTSTRPSAIIPSTSRTPHGSRRAMSTTTPPAAGDGSWNSTKSAFSLPVISAACTGTPSREPRVGRAANRWK
jgi:Glyoxalase/Bleomycin resistance protein/Dioxygenase superfamily